MSWVKLDERASEHRKVLAAGAPAAWLWVCSLMYCNRQKARDGFIPEAAVPALYGPLPNAKKHAERLVEVGLWDRVDGGYRIHDYHDYQPTLEDWEAVTAKRRIAGSLGGKAKANGKQVASKVLSKPPANEWQDSGKRLAVSDPIRSEKRGELAAQSCQDNPRDPASGVRAVAEVIGIEGDYEQRRAKALADIRALEQDPSFASGGKR